MLFHHSKQSQIDNRENEDLTKKYKILNQTIKIELTIAQKVVPDKFSIVPYLLKEQTEFLAEKNAICENQSNKEFELRLKTAQIIDDQFKDVIDTDIFIKRVAIQHFNMMMYFKDPIYVLSYELLPDQFAKLFDNVTYQRISGTSAEQQVQSMLRGQL